MPGAGKSSVGRQLASRLGLPFLDGDREIERLTGQSVARLFASAGEEAFRNTEEQVLATLLRSPAGVLATGGGVVLRPANRVVLKANSTVIYLDANVDELHRRLRGDQHRPLLQVADPLARLREMHQTRDPLYRETAHIVVHAGGTTVKELVSRIVGELVAAGVVPHALPPSTGP
jgi:shikimate kinase